MKTLSEFEIEEYKKVLSRLDLSDENEEKTSYFDAWNFGKGDGNYIVTNNLPSISEETFK